VRELAERGYDGARIERIVDAAGVNQGRHIAKSPYIQKLYNPLLDTLGEVLRSGGGAARALGVGTVYSYRIAIDDSRARR
jgi:hypothetical protein